MQKVEALLSALREALGNPASLGQAGYAAPRDCSPLGWNLGAAARGRVFAYGFAYGLAPTGPYRALPVTGGIPANPPVGSQAEWSVSPDLDS
jgi:hypothetical protein